MGGAKCFEYILANDTFQLSPCRHIAERKKCTRIGGWIDQAKVEPDELTGTKRAYARTSFGNRPLQTSGPANIDDPYCPFIEQTFFSKITPHGKPSGRGVLVDTIMKRFVVDALA